MKEGTTRVGPTVDADCIRTQLMMMESTQYVSANRPQGKESNGDHLTHPNSPLRPPLLELILAGIVTFPI